MSKKIVVGKATQVEHARRRPRDPKPLLDARGTPASGERVGHVGPEIPKRGG